MCRWGAAGEIRIPAGVSCPPSRYLPAAMSSSPRRSAVAILVAGIAIVGCGGDSDSATGSECLSSLAIPGDGAIDFVDYDMARETGALADADELGAPGEDTSRAYIDLADRGISFPRIINVPFSRAADGPVGISDIRCAISAATEATEVLVLADDVEVAEQAWPAPLLLDDDRLAIGPDDDDLAALLATPDTADAEGIRRSLVDAMSARSAHQGVVLTRGADPSSASAVGEAMGDDGRQLLVVWTTDAAEADEVEQTFRDSLVASREADDLAIDDADVTVTDELLVASIPIVGDAAVMQHILRVSDILLLRTPPS